MSLCMITDCPVELRPGRVGICKGCWSKIPNQTKRVLTKAYETGDNLWSDLLEATSETLIEKRMEVH